MTTLEPFSDVTASEHDLWVVHELDIIDKHRTVLIAAARFDALEFGFDFSYSAASFAEWRRSQGDTDAEADEAARQRVEVGKAFRWALQPEAEDRRVELGTALLVKKADGFIDAPAAHLKIAVDEPGVVDLEEVGPLLDRLAAAVDSVIARFSMFV